MPELSLDRIQSMLCGNLDSALAKALVDGSRSHHSVEKVEAAGRAMRSAVKQLLELEERQASPPSPQGAKAKGQPVELQRSR